MERLSEYDVARSYIGKSVDSEKFKEVFEEDYNRYIAYGEYLYDDFGITDALYDRWRDKGIDFRVYVALEDGKIAKCYIFKYEDSSGGYSCRPQGCEASPTQQEIRIFRRIMDYVVQG